MDDPRGGVRHVIPSQGNYLRKIQPLSTGGEADPFARHVLPLFEEADEIAIVAAFIQESGLERIQSAILDALHRGSRIRIIAGDYLDITQASALEMLLDWEQASGTEDEAFPGYLETRVVEVERLPWPVRSFHPKAWRFESESFGIAFVGSSNLSRSALDTGIEWNLRVDRDRDSIAYRRIREAFESLWASARRLDAKWIADYARRARRSPSSPFKGEIEAEPLVLPPPPHEVQVEALASLREIRDRGHRRALVVLATGLGKTWLAAFDYAQLREKLGRRPRLLFLAHRSELLRQAARTYRCLLRNEGEIPSVGWFAGDEGELDADLVFASIAKLSRIQHLPRLRSQAFDYVVVDEVHHAAADSYRRVLDSIDPHFLLGLTATPDRADAADVLGLFNDLVAFSAGIPRGIEMGRLVPFNYFGVKDEIDYENIPWRNRRFDAEELAKAAQTEARMQTLWRAWHDHPGKRSLLFCCSIEHACFVRKWLRTREVRVDAVFAGPGSDDREKALKNLERGELDAVCAVDIFNEGVDVPTVDRIVMLRPTESNVIFLQQLGRGLRIADGKSAVVIIDFVGNHRIFLERVRTLLSLGDTPATAESVKLFLRSESPEDLPEGCSVNIELEAKTLLARLFQVSGVDEVERAYHELALERGALEDPSSRPTAGELQRMGYLPNKLRQRHGSWFEFVRAQGNLTPDGVAVLDVARDFLREVETTAMVKSFKMITLEALCEDDRLLTGMPLKDLALRCHAVLRRSPELIVDVVPESLRGVPLNKADESKWFAYWNSNPIQAWTGGNRNDGAWFQLKGDLFVLDLVIKPELASTLTRMTRELVDYRLAQYVARNRQAGTSLAGFVCKVAWNRRDPIMKLPPRVSMALPEGETDVKLPGGEIWQFRFAKEFCNVARPPGVPRNQLPDLLRGWFGPRAGHPGTAFQVRFHVEPDGLWVEPVQTRMEISSRHRVIGYPDLRAAAGHLADNIESPDAEVVWLPIENPSSELFAVRVSGTSMDGGKQPLRDGDWAVMRVCRGQSASALQNRVVLVEVPTGQIGSGYQIKRLRRDGVRWLLTSDNPQGPTIEADGAMVAIARLDLVISPSQLAPLDGTLIRDIDLSSSFGLDYVAPQSGRYGGHLFIFVTENGELTAPNRVTFTRVTPHPSETAFILSRQDNTSWRYLGLGRQTHDHGVWAIPDVDRRA